MQHQVAAVIVAMAEHARFAGQFLDDRRPLGAECLALRVAERRALVGNEVVLDEELELPRELLDVERDLVGRVSRRRAATRRAAACGR